ncbi:MAG: 50S ribosomal protein L30e [Promethearchaeia archaeon]
MAKKRSKKVGASLDLSRRKIKEFDIDTNIKVAYKTGKIVYGKKQVLKGLREDKFKMLIVANNIPKEFYNQLTYYNSLMDNKLYIHKYKGSSWDLGLACAKPYMISVIGVIDPGDSDLLTLKSKSSK